MSEGKGLNGWAKWLVGVLFTVLFTGFTTLTTAVIANDEKARDRDTKIKEELTSCVKEQMMTNQKILIMLARIETKMGIEK
jgi:hypothetical protein